MPARATSQPDRLGGQRPEDVKTVVRRLLRNRERPNLEAAAELIDWYRAHWEAAPALRTPSRGNMTCVYWDGPNGLQRAA